MSVLYTNNAATTLASGITNSATSLTVATGAGSLFPAITNGDYFYATIENSGMSREVVKVTARSTDTFTIVRAQDGTTAAAWNAGDKVELRITKAMLDQLKADAIAAYTAADVLAKLLTVDGAGSGLDADTLDGNHAAAFALSGHNHNGTYQAADADLTAIAALAGTSGLLKKTAADTWALDTSAYLTGITSGMVTTALGFTPYNATNPSGYITGITSGNVTTALGFTPLSTTGKAADSDLLDGQHGSYYQPASTAITTGNIGSQSVSYATSAGTASTCTGNATTASTASALTTGNNYQMASLGVGTAASGVAGEIRATNNVTAYYSDARLKTFTGKIENAVDKVMQLNGYYFVENETAKALGYNNDKLQVGVSAQEVEAVLPEVVTAAPISDEYKTVYYDKLVPLLIEAIKELKQEITALKGL